MPVATTNRTTTRKAATKSKGKAAATRVAAPKISTARLASARPTATSSKGRKSAKPAPKRAAAVIAAPPPIDAAVEALVAWAIDEGLRTGDLDDLVLDAHLDLARKDHVPEHIKISGQRDAVCEAEEEKAYDAALAVNLSGFDRQFRFLVERIATARPQPAASDPVELIRGWVERYRAG